MPNEVSIDVRMSEQTEDDTSGGQVQARLSVRVSDPSGSPLPEATITVSGTESDYEQSKSAKRMGMSQTFEGVPIPATVMIEATGYQTETIDVREGDIGGEIVVGY